MGKIISDHLKTLNRINKSVITEAPEDHDYDYNCWGFTAHVMGYSDELLWLDDYEMEEILADNTKHVDSPQIGDIGVWNSGGASLLHTATVVQVKPEVVFIHKPGNWQLACESLATISQRHDNYLELTEYRRQN